MACKALGIDTEEAIEEAYTFSALEHRLEQIELYGERLAVNDSKATTVSATLAACKALVDSNLGRKMILLLGGREKSGSDWQPISDFIASNKNHFSKIILFGECREKLQVIFASCVAPVETYENLSKTCDALPSSLNKSNVVLLSPGCASFDEFVDFEDRGRFFKNKLKNVTRVDS